MFRCAVTEWKQQLRAQKCSVLPAWCRFLRSTGSAKLTAGTLTTTPANYGIKIIREGEDYVVIWKASNVGLSVNDAVVRPAAPPIEQWLRRQYPSRPTKVISQLSPKCSGLVFVSLKDSATSSDFSPQKFGYIAVVRGDVSEGSSTTNVDMDDTSVDEWTREGVAVTRLSSSCSSRGQLFLVRVTGTNPMLASPRELTNALAVRGIHVVSNFLTLVELTLISTRGESQCPPVEVSVTVDTPRKYEKFMKREHLFHRRKELCGSPPAFTASHSTTLFQGLSILYPARGSLQPRQSSACLVDAARRILVTHYEHAPPVTGKHPSPVSPAVLDLGTGSGALLLALKTLSLTSTNFPPSTSCSGRVLPSASLDLICSVRGLGVDINSEALALAKKNAAALLSQDQAQMVRFQEGCFSKLNELHRQLQAMDASGDRADARYEGFDIIMCNPPFLSSSAARGRVTAEGSQALVAGRTGYEAYEALCSSLQASLQEDSPSLSTAQGITTSSPERSGPLLLKPHGRLILQISAADKALGKVASILSSHGFCVDEVLIEAGRPGRKAIRRALVAIVKNQQQS